MEQRIEVGSLVKIKNGLKNLEYYGLCAWFKEFDNLMGEYIEVDKKIEVLPDTYVYTLKDVDTMLLVTPEMVEDVVNEFKCSKCGKEIEVDDMVSVNGQVWCKDCAKQEFPCCDECGEPMTKDVFTVDGKTLCKKCFDKKYILHDGTIYSKDECTLVDGQVIPNDKLEEKAFKCTNCGKWHLKSKKATVELNVCRDCWSGMKNLIRDYHNYESCFFEIHKDCDENIDKIPTLGFELEVEPRGSKYERKETSYLINDVMDDLTVFEYDGSLDDGFEIISHPMTLSYAHKCDKLKDMFDVLQRTKYGDTGNTGLHIHVGRQCLGSTEQKRDDTITKILVILETFQKEVCNFARRNPNGYCRFLTDSSGKKTLKYVKRNRSGDRYTVLNENNCNTIEFRIFKATDDYETLMATLELVNNIVLIARDRDIDGLKWSDIINFGSTNKYLKDYNNTVNTETDTVICLASDLELHKDNYTLKKFIDGQFGMQLRDTSKVNRLSKYFVGNLYAYGITHHSVYDDLESCLYRKIDNHNKICVKECNGKLRLVSEMDGVEDIQDFEDVYEMWIDNPELFTME